MFDDKDIKAMLHDAEEKVSPGIWSAVSSGLDAASAPVRSSKVAAVWKWSGAALAVAAGLAAVLLIPGRDNLSVEPALTESVAQAVPAADSAPAAPLIEDEDIAPVSDAGRPLPVTKAVPVRENVVEEVTEAPIPEEHAPDRKMPVGTAPASDFACDNMIAMLGPESVQRRGGKPDIVIGGVLSGNTANRLTISHMSGGSGSVPSEDIISENSVSSFGIPFTVGVGLRWNPAPRFFIGTGLDYSLLTRTFDGTYTAAGSVTQIKGEVRNSMHYIGIPVNLFYNIVDTDAIDFYMYGGGEAEYCVSNRYDLMPVSGDRISVFKKVDRLQFSAKFGIGVQFRLTNRLGLYLDPGVSYYFYSGQPKSIRTEQPLMFNFNAGLRFDL